MRAIDFSVILAPLALVSWIQSSEGLEILIVLLPSDDTACWGLKFNPKS